MRSGPRARWLQKSTACVVCALAAAIVTPTKPTPLRRLILAVERDDASILRARLTDFPIVPLAQRDDQALGLNTTLRHTSLTVPDALQAAAKTDDAHLRGVALLLSRYTSTAIGFLEKSTQQRPHDAGVWNDLGAAYYEAGRQRNNPEDFGKSLAACTRATILDPTNQAARFNRTLAVSALNIQPSEITARKRWTIEQPRLERSCLDHNSAETLQIIKRHPQSARAWAESVYPAQWAEAAQSGAKDVAARALRIARCVSSGLAATTGETLAADAVASIDLHQDSDALPAAYLAYRKARMLYAARSVAEAKPLFDRAAILFNGIPTPLSLVVAYYKANVAFDQEDDETAFTLLSQVSRQAKPSYKALRAQVSWQQSTVLARHGRIYESLLSARKARDAFLGIHETNNATRMQISIASLLAILGQRTEAWRARREAFSAASTSGEPLLLESALSTAAQDELVEHHWDLAAALFNEQARLPSASPRLHAEALLWEQVALSRAMAVAPDFRRALIATKAIPDPILRDEVFDQYRLANASTTLRNYPQQAICFLDATIAFRTERRLSLDLPEAYLERALALRRMNATRAAAADLERAIGQLEKQRGSIREILLRDTYFDTVANVFDVATDLALAEHNFRRVFELGERRRARIIIDRANTSPLTLTEARQLMPADTALVQITTLEHRTVALIITDSTVRAVELPLTRNSVVTMRSAFLSAISADDRSQENRIARRLFGALIAPLSKELSSHSELVIVPDESTAGIPFAALIDSAGRYLIEQTTIVLAPSATAYFAVRRHYDSPPQNGMTLIVADPTLDDTFGDLPPLLGARREAREVASHHSNTRVLIGTLATRRAVLSGMMQASTIHFAAHAIANLRNPMLSSIPLASTDGEPSELSVADVAHLNLPKHPMVILAGCRTASATHTGSLRDFAAAFLAAGSTSVIGTLWDVSDDDASALSIALHRELAAGRRTPAQALRYAQMVLMHSTRSRQSSSRAWSGFQYYGS